MNTLRQAVRDVFGHATRPGIQAAGSGHGANRFRVVSGPTSHHLHHSGIGAQLGATTIAHSTGSLGSTVELRTRIRAVSQRHDPRTQIPPQGLLPFQPKRARPFLYSDDNIRNLLRAALRMECRYERGKLRPWVYYCLFGLLSVSGLRLGEACNLELQDVDLKAAVLTIRGAKFGKDRLVPLHRSTCAVLAKYIARRLRHWEERAVSSYLFVSSWGNRLDTGDIHRTFYMLSRQIGLRGPSDKYGPRIHDLRHRFATMTLLRWYRSGKDVERRLPFFPPILAMSTSATPIGISVHGPS